MSLGMTLAVTLYALATLQTGVFGLVFAIRNRPMPYHLDALAPAKFDDLPPGGQVLMNNAVGLIGGLCLAIAIALGGLIAGPLTDGAPWARWVVPLVMLTTILSIGRTAHNIGSQTPANPPVWLLWLASTLVLGALVASWF